MFFFEYIGMIVLKAWDVLKVVGTELWGFVLATISPLLPVAWPYVAKYLTSLLALTLAWIHAKLGIEYISTQHMFSVEFLPTWNDAVSWLVTTVIGGWAVWRMPNKTATTAEKRDPIVAAVVSAPAEGPK